MIEQICYLLSIQIIHLIHEVVLYHIKELFILLEPIYSIFLLFSFADSLQHIQTCLFRQIFDILFYILPQLIIKQIMVFDFLNELLIRCIYQLRNSVIDLLLRQNHICLVLLNQSFYFTFIFPLFLFELLLLDLLILLVLIIPIITPFEYSSVNRVIFHFPRLNVLITSIEWLFLHQSLQYF